ncbi:MULTISPECIES: hypothetical protein [Acinetobacter]|jgi:hypothetical protein|uniref:Lipoprotein n=1 Tax=Acinetobacter baumannii EGD-HP18 TaxID=1358412 RepID=A0AAV3K133_ACIBA|nr:MULTISPECIES: hypothetical protein [Acinetobacter]ERH70166.1 hypothetical protein N173_15470 [Acinetobacter baumannii EGD-HP18]MCZ3123759.1 hypothetical protein [Acinetobacter baumannii]MCZ3322289.1 hypothetical protein [Acinetobacter baumannii]MDA3569274.1 hypothetical protein [Acinetobacter sp. AOR12_HL]MDN8143629.1 hypothetical protein [Acinetobacter baumannii]
MMGKSNHYIYSIIFLILLVLTSCGKKYTITPDSLPIAHVNQNYQQIINISGGKTVDKYVDFKNNIPDDLGISVSPDESSGYNQITIKGIPKYTGVFTIYISTGFYAGGDAEINKTYTLKVEE